MIFRNLCCFTDQNLCVKSIDIIINKYQVVQELNKGDSSGHSRCSGHNGVVVYGGGDIVFGAKRSN